MENASKALIMAGGILIGLLILALLFTLMISSKDFFSTYDNQKKQEFIQQFNANFIKYLGQDLTIHDAITICNFTNLSSNGIAGVTIEGTMYDKTHIMTDITDANNKLANLREESNEYYKVEIVYSLTIVAYDKNNGYISKIKIEPQTKKYKYYKKIIQRGK